MYGKTQAADRAVIDQVGVVAAARGVPRAQVALAWVRQSKGVVAPIIGASKSSQLTDAIGALSLTLSTEEIALLEQPYVPHAVVGVRRN